VDNLVDNALQFAPPGSQVVISAELAGGSLVIDVRDCGPGFPPDFLPHAFERFRRPDQGRARSAGGAGLGLAIVQAIAVAHGGRAVAGHRPEGGATVRLELPYSQGAEGP
jgi:signal transduction histidine kinase